MKEKNKEKLRIAMLGHKRIPSREGGIEVVVEELATRMAKLNHEVICYNRGGKHVSDKSYSTESLKEYKGVTLKKVFTIDRKGLAAMSASCLSSICCAFGKYDVVHFHALGPCATLWIPKLFGKKCVATVHGLDHQRAKWGRLARTYIMMGEKCAVKYADEMIVLSKGVQQYYQDTYGRETVFIPNGVTKPERKEAELITEKLGLHKDDYVLYLGRIVPEKGIQYLIEAFKEVDTDKKLVIAGGASDTSKFMSELKATAESDERIVFTGFVQGQMLEELYSNAYVYVLPSDLEGMPLSLLEAMSYGNCCLVSSIPECVDVVENKAVVFEMSNIKELQEKLQLLCDSSELVQKYKADTSSFICGKYDWDDVVRKTLELYKKGK